MTLIRIQVFFLVMHSHHCDPGTRLAKAAIIALEDYPAEEGATAVGITTLSV